MQYQHILAIADANVRQCGGLTGSPGKSQKEDQGDQESAEHPIPFKVPWSSWPSFWLFPGNPVNPSHCLALESAIACIAAWEVDGNMGELLRPTGEGGVGQDKQ